MRNDNHMLRHINDARDDIGWFGWAVLFGLGGLLGLACAGGF